eukprot:204674-Amphidinium_carterae.1
MKPGMTILFDFVHGVASFLSVLGHLGVKQLLKERELDWANFPGGGPGNTAALKYVQDVVNKNQVDRPLGLDRPWSRTTTPSSTRPKQQF